MMMSSQNRFNSFDNLHQGFDNLHQVITNKIKHPPIFHSLVINGIKYENQNFVTYILKDNLYEQYKYTLFSEVQYLSKQTGHMFYFYQKMSTRLYLTKGMCHIRQYDLSGNKYPPLDTTYTIFYEDMNVRHGKYNQMVEMCLCNSDSDSFNGDILQIYEDDDIDDVVEEEEEEEEMMFVVDM